MSQLGPPVRSLAERLPFQELHWRRFQLFCQDLIPLLPGVRDCHQYGVEGNPQDGIDLIADLDGGEHRAFQNKRWRSFGPQNVRDAVRATTYQADQYIILLSRDATVGVRQAVAEYPAWDVWDGTDLSRRVRELPTDAGRRLVDTHFGPYWRREFLGIPAIAAFLPPADYFRPFQQPGHRLNHSLPLVGRAAYVEQLAAFARSPNHRVAVMVGRGGMGKTKLLFEICQWIDEHLPALSERLLVDTAPITADSLDELPAGPCVVMADDAHRREDLGLLLAAVRHYDRPSKLVLATRPQAVEHLISELTRAGFDPREVMRFDPLPELGRDETLELARSALGPNHEHLAERLTAATRDCPLATVIGGRLLAAEAMPPELLERHADFQTAALGRWRDEIVGDLGTTFPPSTCQAALRLISAVAPLPAESGPVHRACAAELGLDTVQFSQLLGALEQAGILVRRGHRLRISPDVLSDHILHEACLTPQGRPTGYAASVFASFREVSPAQVLRNLAELDWRVSLSSAGESELLAGVWDAIETDFRGCSHWGRQRWCEVLREVAYYQPARVYDLVRFAYRNPAAPGEVEERLGEYAPTHESVVDQLPDLLRRIAYTLEYLPRCLDLLWQIGRDDGRPTGPRPAHAMRVLADLAAYDPDRPLAVNRAVLDAVRRWLRQPGAHAHRHSPLDVLDPLLAKSGEVTRSRGHTLLLGGFQLRRDDVRELHEAAIALLRGCAADHDTRVVLRSIGSLHGALGGPVGYFGNPVTDEDQQQWEPEYLAVLAVLDEVVARPVHPTVLLRVLEAVGWHARYGRLPAVRDRAREVIASVQQPPDFRVTAVLLPLHRVWTLINDDEAQSPAAGDVHRHLEQSAEFRRRAAEDLKVAHPSADRLLGAIDGHVTDLESLGMEPNMQPLVQAIMEVAPELAEPIAGLILADPGRPTARCLSLVLINLSQRSFSRSVEMTQRAAASPAPVLRRAAAQFLAWSGNWSNADTGALTAVQATLFSDPDVSVRRHALDALKPLGRVHPRRAIDL
ncbi:MAG TPA: restriction endonuclease, partial [Gemmataceae bacterium]